MNHNSNNNNEGARVGGEAHSLDDSENSGALQDEFFLDGELYGIFGDDGNIDDALVEFDPSIVIDQPPQLSEHNHNNNSNMQPQAIGEIIPDQHRSSRPKSRDGGSPAEITQQQQQQQQQQEKTGKTRRRSSKLEGENRGLPPPGWHSEAADKQHRQEMILEMYVCDHDFC